MWYILLIALANLAIGFLLAVAQSRRQPQDGRLFSAERTRADAPSPESGRDPGPQNGTSRDTSGARLTLDELSWHVARYEQQLMAVRDRLQAAEQPYQADLVSSSVCQLAAAHREFLSREADFDTIFPAGAGPESAETHHHLLALWQQQRVEVGEAERWTSEFRPSGDLSSQCREMMAWTEKLAGVGGEFRNTLAEAMAGFTSAATSDVEAAEPCPQR